MDSIQTTIDVPMPEAESAVREALAAQGFGILTEIDVAATLQAKLRRTSRPQDPRRLQSDASPTRH